MVTVLVIGIVFMSGCTGTGSTGTTVNATPTPQPVNETAPVMPALTPAITVVPTPIPELTPVPTPSNQDPIIGAWQNGMVFHADGTVGSEEYTTWKVNGNGNHSYFVITDMPNQGEHNQRDVTSAEWIYNPFSDKIHKRGSSITFSRELPVPETTSIPAGTRIQTPATAVPTTEVTVTTTTAVPTTKTPVTTISTVPTTKAPEATIMVVPPSKVPATTTTAVPTTKVPVATITDVLLSVEDGTGSLFIRTGGVGNDVYVFIVREGTNVLPVNNVFDPFGMVVESQISGYVQVKILPDGCSERVSLPAGNYIAYLPDKYGGVPEQQSFTIYKDNITTISFMALSYRASSGGGCGG